MAGLNASRASDGKRGEGGATRDELLAVIAAEEARVASLDRERAAARVRLESLRQRLIASTPPGVMTSGLPLFPTAPIPQTPIEKVRLFRSLFRGREDVFPVRFVSKKTGKPGYAPACANKFVRGVCGLPRVKCGECPNQAFLPVADRAVLDHLRGRHVMGVYLLRDDETCWFLAVDFDKASWQDDVVAFIGTCRSFAVPVAVERSRSGSGAHAWFFFGAPVAASVARKMGCYLITETMARRREQIAFRFQGELTPVQEQAAGAFLRHDIGVLVAPAGIGKTVLGTYLVAQRSRRTLVLVHRRPLLDQWVAQLSMFLGIGEKEVGQIGGGRRKPNGHLDVAMIQSLVRKESVDDIVATYGHVIVDECHHVPAVSFERALSAVKARYVIGLTATPQRRDGHHPIIELQLGPVRFPVDSKSQAARRPFDHRLIVRETSFRLNGVAGEMGMQDIYRAVAADEARNRLILDDVILALKEGWSPILLTERRDHLEYFAQRFRSLVPHLVVLHGGMTPNERRERVAVLAAVSDQEQRLVLATGRYIGEGFDDARLDTLFLAMPVSWKGTLVQYAGRLQRLHPRKWQVRIFDYVDREVPLLLRMFEKRMRAYRAIGYAREEAAFDGAAPVEQAHRFDQEV